MLLSCVKASKNLHLVDNFSVLFGFFALELLHLLQVKQASLNDKLFAADSFVKAPIVQLNHAIFQLNVLRCVIIKELHIGQEQLCVHVVLLLKVAPFGQVAQHFMTVLLC